MLIHDLGSGKKKFQVILVYLFGIYDVAIYIHLDLVIEIVVSSLFEYWHVSWGGNKKLFSTYSLWRIILMTIRCL